MKKKLGAVIIILVFALCVGVVPTVAPPLDLDVAVDIKPESCPNPLSLHGKGVLPVAILGDEAFDVTQVDPETVRLTIDGLGVGVPPLRWSLDDVGTPFEPYMGKVDCLDCTTEGPDGWLDLSLKFKTQEVIDTLGLSGFADGQCVVLLLTGNLKAEFGGGTPIEGEDVVIILVKPAMP